VKTKYPLLVIVGAGVILRLWLWGCFSGQPLSIYDEKHLYNPLAENLLSRGEFALEPGEATACRPPLYPLFVAGVYAVSGVDNLQAVRLAQAGLSVATALLLYFIGSVIGSRRAALWLCGLYCFYPSLLVYNNLLLTEVLFIFLLSAACYGLILLQKSGAISCAVASGTLLALAALTRSVLWPFPVLLSGCLAFTLPGKWGCRLLAVGALLGAFAVTLAPWAIRCTRLEKTLTVIDTTGGRNFMLGNYRHTPLYRAWDAIALEGDRSWHHELAMAEPSFAGATQGQRDRLALEHAVAFVAMNPVLTVKRDLVKFFNFWQLERELVAGASRGLIGNISLPMLAAIAGLIMSSYAVTMILGIFGMIMLPPPRPMHWLLLCVMGFVWVMHTLSFGHSRYHLPLIPIVLVYSARAIVYRRLVWRRRTERPFWLAAGLSSVLALYWVMEVGVIDFERWRMVVGGLG
jgi:4-amino-4-deoxy-L-arabinose transferase-like glycosyltransferase